MHQFRDYYSRLSAAQKQWYLFGLALAAAIVAVGVAVTSGGGEGRTAQYTVDQSIGEVASGLEVTGKSLARELALPLDAPKKKPLRSLGISQDKLDAAAKHLESHEPSGLTYFVYVAIVAFGLIYMVRLGRPDGSPFRERKHWYNRLPYTLVLLATLIVSGFVLGKSPNPMEGIVKVFKAMVGLYPSVWDKFLVLAFFLLLAVLGNKLVCGWACPFGALQELVYSLPIFKTLKKRKLPFAVGNSIRVALFVAALAFLFGIAGNSKGFVLYHGLNPFNLFDYDLEMASIAATVIICLILAAAVYRPFCHYICPFGLVSWVLERFSLARVRIDPDRCTQCGACARACASLAALGRVERKRFPADCFSCARCLSVCPEDAISYRGPVLRK